VPDSDGGYFIPECARATFGGGIGMRGGGGRVQGGERMYWNSPETKLTPNYRRQSKGKGERFIAEAPFGFAQGRLRSQGGQGGARGGTENLWCCRHSGAQLAVRKVRFSSRAEVKNLRATSKASGPPEKRRGALSYRRPRNHRTCNSDGATYIRLLSSSP